MNRWILVPRSLEAIRIDCTHWIGAIRMSLRDEANHADCVESGRGGWAESFFHFLAP